jgi:hypothetical protein
MGNLCTKSPCPSPPRAELTQIDVIHDNLFVIQELSPRMEFSAASLPHFKIPSLTSP